MAKSIPVLIVLALFLSVFNSCTDKCEGTVTYTYFEPVYQTTASIREQVDVTGPQLLDNSGKIYVYGKYIFINEREKGIHVIDNSNPSDPVFKSFINIPGNYDLAVKNNTLYADSYIDLLAFDISNVEDIRFLSRAESVFPYYFNDFGIASVENSILTDWVESSVEQVTVEDCSINTSGDIYFFGGLAMEDFAAAPEASGAVPPPNGVAGSMARFTIMDDMLYAVDMSAINVIDISTLSEPHEIGEYEVGWGVETIFPFKENLFIGTNRGMLIYDVTDREIPSFVSEFAHVTACDPVVANEEHAFVTLRSGNACQGIVNQLDVLDISTITNPFLVKTYNMQNPHGLGLDGNTLFLCEGEFGLKIFDIRNVNSITENQIIQYPEMHAFDVIPNNGILIMIGEDGLSQYDYSDLEDIKLLSTLQTGS